MIDTEPMCMWVTPSSICRKLESRGLIRSTAITFPL